MALLTVAEIREHVDTDLTDTALQQIIDAEDQEIEYYLGAISEQTDRFNPPPESKVIWPTRRATSITKVTEIYPESFSGSTTVVLSANDYSLVANGTRVDRLPTGDNPRTYWADTVKVEYVPYDDTKRRKVMLVKLVKLSLAFSGDLSSDLPDYREKQFEDHQTEREKILFGARGRWYS